jgi:hypothetical protein
MTVSAVVGESDPFGETIYYLGSTLADLLPGARNAVELALLPAVAVEPRTTSVKLGQSAVFTAAAAEMDDANLAWHVNGVFGGDATMGVVTQTNPATYYAPVTATATAVVVSASFSVDKTTYIGGAFVTLAQNDLLPAISGFSPASGPPGTVVTISGSNFGTGGNVLFSGVAAESIESWAATAISAVVPAGAATGPITVRTAEGTAESNENFTVTYPAPSVSGFSPASGAPGTPVTVTGRWFGAEQGLSAISFGGVKADTVYYWSETEVRTAVPQGAVSGKISVKTEWGTAESANSFTVLLPAPVITGFEPTAGLPGEEVTLSGRDFGDGNASSAGFSGAQGRVSAAVTAWTDTEIRLVVPDSAISGPVWVTTPGGTAESSATFVVRAPAPVISGLSPALTSDNTPGFSLRVAGRWFVSGSVVAFGGTNAATGFKSDKEITAAITDEMVATPGDVEVTVTNPDGGSSAPQTFRVYAGAVLSFPSVSAGAPAISSGQTGVPVIVKVKNDGEAPANIASISLRLLGQSGQDVAGDFVVSPQFGTPGFLAGGAEKAFAFTLAYAAAPAYSGTVTAAPVISATDGYSGVVLSPAPAQASFAAQKAAAVAVRQVAVEASDKTTLGQAKKVTVTFENTGEAEASITAAALVFSAPDGKDRSADFTATTSTLFPAELAGGATLPVEFNVQTNAAGQPGAVTIDVAAAAVDSNTRAAIQVTPPGTKGALTLQTPPVLSLSALSLSKSTVNLGQAGLSLLATVHNAGEAAAAIESLKPEFKDAGGTDVTADYVITPTDAYPASVPGGGDAVLGFQVSVQPGANKGLMTAGIKEAVATDSNTGAAAAVSGTPTAQWTVQAPASLNILGVTSSQGTVHVLDSGVSLAVTVENTGDSPAKITSVAARFTQGANDVTSSFASVLQTALPATVAGQSLQQFTFLFGAPAGAPVGTTVIDAGLTFEDTVSGAADSRPSAQSTATIEVRHKLTVTVSSPVSWVYAGGAAVQLTYSVKDENGNDPANTGVTWSVEGGLPVGVGTISGTGLYTPPAKALEARATIRATSAEDTAFSATTDIDLKHVLTVSVTPSAKNVYVNGATTQFSAVVKDETDAVHATAVTWSVLGGAAAEVGSITAGGLYTAPAKWWVASGTVKATSEEDNSFFGTAALTFKHTYSVDILPKDISIYVRAAPIQFNATVIDDGGASAPQGVTWSVEGGTAQQVGSIDAISGMYTPPSDMTVAGASIRATSKDDAAFSSTTTVTFKHILTVTVTPPAPGIHTGTTKQFTAEVRDEVNALHGSGVTWSLVEVGNVGSIDPVSGLYTAPASSPDPGVTVKAVSNEDSAASGTAAVALWDGPPNIVWQATTTRLGPKQGWNFIADVTNASETGVTFHVDGVQGGNATVGLIDAAGAYEAPAVLPPLPTVTVKASSNEEPSVFVEQEVIIAVGLYQTRYRLDIDEGAATFNATILDGNTDLEILGGGLFTGSCGVGCVTVDVPLSVRSITQSQYDATCVSFHTLPAQITPRNLSGGSTAGPVGCAATATVFGGTTPPTGPLFLNLGWDNASAATTYSLEIEVGSELPYLDQTGPFGGALNDTVSLTGGFLGNSAAAAEGNRVVLNGFDAPEGSVTKWSDTGIDLVVPVGASTGPLDVYRNGFKVLFSGQAFSFGRHTVVGLAQGNEGSYMGGAVWVEPGEARIFYSGLVPSVNIGLFADTIPSTGAAQIRDTVSQLGAIHVAGADMFYGAGASLYQKAAGDLGSGTEQVNSYSSRFEYGLVTHNGMVFWVAEPEGWSVKNATYGAQFLEGAECPLPGNAMYGLDATSDGKVLFAYYGATPTVAYVDSATPDTYTDVGTIFEPSPEYPGYRAFWLNPADDSVLFQFDDGSNGPGLYRSAIAPWAPQRVMALAIAGQGESLTAVVHNGKFYYLINDPASGYVLLKWKEIAGAGEGTVAYVSGEGTPPKYMFAAGGNLYYGCMNGDICRSALVP